MTGNSQLRRIVRNALLAALLPCSSLAAQTAFDSQIEEVSNKVVGIDFVHTDGGSGKRYIMESVIGSLALFDYDGDGFTDIYFMNGAPLKGSVIAPAPTNRLYRNNGNWTFTDVTETSGVGDLGYGLGVVVGDYDQDGDPDLFLSNYGFNSFYINNGDGTFTEAAEFSGVRGPHRFGAGNTFFDMDNDGDLDLYCASYIEFAYSDYKIRTIAGHQFHTGPIDYVPAADILFRNNGDGSFSDVSDTTGISALRAPGMGVLAADFDEDGDCDVFVANDQEANFLLINDGQGNFTDDGIIAGVAFDRLGNANGNMGVDYADIDGDQLLDLITTTYQDESPVFYQSLGTGFFNDATNIAKIDPALIPHVNWGIGAVDFDNDSDLDVNIVCGHFLDNIRFIDDRTDVKVGDYLLANDGNGKLTNVTDQAGSFFKRIESGRGAGYDDLDNDGDMDIVVLNFNASPSLGRNFAPTANESINIKLIGTKSNRDAVGSRITLTTPSGKQRTFVTFSGKGYESYYGQRTHVGLGTRMPSELQSMAIDVTWPNGNKEKFLPDEEFTQHPFMTLIEGQGQIQQASVSRPQQARRASE